MDKYSISVISAFIGAAVAIFTNYWRTRYTIKSQDLSKRIEELSQSISKLEAYACEYWTSEDRSKNSANHYAMGFQTKIELMIQYLDKQHTRFNDKSVSRSLNEFTGACTGGSFNDKSGKPEPDRVRRILITGESLKIELMKIRNLHY
ncbi:MAG: hypothetical protein GY831_23750 [Delftia sp.]|nr:hypothetical protein [Delftia sp.]MCP4458519.1 hypothetical protein [Cytophagales bacterium]MCP4534224.1 hypothetical protein [Delftia sp.]